MDKFAGWGPPGDLLGTNSAVFRTIPLIHFCAFARLCSTHVSIFVDDNGWEICREHMGLVEECHTGNTEEK